MSRALAISLVSAAVVCTSPCSTGGEEKTEEKPALVVTEKDFGREFTVKNGDLIRVSLPAAVPLLWVPKDGPVDTLKLVEPVAKAPAGDPPRKGQPPVLGGTARWARSYRINSERPAKLEPSWIYAQRGKVEVTNQRIKDGTIPPPPTFRPDQKPSDVREGMDFHFKLEIRP